MKRLVLSAFSAAMLAILSACVPPGDYDGYSGYDDSSSGDWSGGYSSTSESYGDGGSSESRSFPLPDSLGGGYAIEESGGDIDIINERGVTVIQPDGYGNATVVYPDGSVDILIGTGTGYFVVDPSTQ